MKPPLTSNPPVNKTTNKMLRREVWEILDTKSPAYSQLLYRLSARDTTQLPKQRREYFARLVTWVAAGLSYGWHFGALADGPMVRPTLITGPKFNRVEAWITAEAVRCGFAIGRGYRNAERHARGEPLTPSSAS